MDARLSIKGVPVEVPTRLFIFVVTTVLNILTLTSPHWVVSNFNNKVNNENNNQPVTIGLFKIYIAPNTSYEFDKSYSKVTAAFIVLSILMVCCCDVLALAMLIRRNLRTKHKLILYTYLLYFLSGLATAIGLFCFGTTYERELKNVEVSDDYVIDYVTLGNLRLSSAFDIGITSFALTVTSCIILWVLMDRSVTYIRAPHGIAREE